MKINENLTRVLIYGDSLPWGLVPGSTTFERYSADKRWPGVLQGLLGEKFEIIEECLCARTLDSDDPRPGFEGRNGTTFLPTLLDSHDPVDIIIVSLGLNEIKSIYNWEPDQVADKMRNILETICSRRPNFHDVTPRIILLTQPIVREGTGYWGELWVGSNEKSLALVEEYLRLAQELKIEVVNISDIQTGVDGVHLDEPAHKKIARRIEDRIKIRSKK